MTNGWSTVPLVQVIQQRKEFVTIDEIQQYKRCRVQLHAKGIVLRDVVVGAEIKTKEQQVCRAGEFLVAEIDAKVGGFGVVPEDLEAAIVSSHYFLFVIDDEQLDRRFLDYFIRTPAFREQVNAQGTTNYAAIRPAHVLKYTIPLPPLPEQRRIVARIEELAAKIDEARGLQQKSIVANNTLIASALKWVFDCKVVDRHWDMYPVGEVASVSRGKFTHRPRNDPRFYGGDIPFIQINDISSSDRYITNYSQTLNEEGLQISRMFPVGTVVIAITGATVGATGILGIESCFPDSIVGFQAISEKTLPEYLYWALEYVKGNALAEATQTTQPNINLQILNRLRIPLPSLLEQRRIVAYLDDLQAKVDSLKALQTQSAAELDALLPSILDKAFKGEL